MKVTVERAELLKSLGHVHRVVERRNTIPILANVLIKADKGKLSVLSLGPRSKLDKGNLDKPALDFGADYASLYGDDPGLWVNTNLSPHLPYAAKLWMTKPPANASNAKRLASFTTTSRDRSSPERPANVHARRVSPASR